MKRFKIPKSRELLKHEALEKVKLDLWVFKITLEEAKDKCLALGMTEEDFEEMICPSPKSDYKRHKKKIEDEEEWHKRVRGY